MFNENWVIFSLPEIDDEVLLTMGYANFTSQDERIDGQDLYQCQMNNGRGMSSLPYLRGFVFVILMTMRQRTNVNVL